MTDRDRIFADEYLVDLNAFAAAIRAGYAPTTARNASAWIREDSPEKPKLRALIDQKLAERSKRTGVNQDRVINELAKLAFVNAGDLLDTDTAKVLPGASRDDKAAIAGVRKGKGSEREIRLCDKTRALELLGKHLGMFKDNVQVQGVAPVIIDDSEKEKG